MTGDSSGLASALARLRKNFCACVRICTMLRVGIILAMSRHSRPCRRRPSSNSACSSSVQRPATAATALGRARGCVSGEYTAVAAQEARLSHATCQLRAPAPSPRRASQFGCRARSRLSRTSAAAHDYTLLLVTTSLLGVSIAWHPPVTPLAPPGDPASLMVAGKGGGGVAPAANGRCVAAGSRIATWGSFAARVDCVSVENRMMMLACAGKRRGARQARAPGKRLTALDIRRGRLQGPSGSQARPESLLSSSFINIEYPPVTLLWSDVDGATFYRGGWCQYTFVSRRPTTRATHAGPPGDD